MVVAPGTRHELDVVLGPHRLEIAGRSIALDDIRSVAYATAAQKVNLVHRQLRRRLEVGHPDGNLSLDLGSHRFGRRSERSEAAAFAAVVQLLHDQVEPRLRREHVDTLRSGGAVAVGPLLMTARDLTIVAVDTVRSWPWRAVPVAELRGDHVAICDAGRDGATLCRVDAMSPDAVMLPELLWSAAAALV